MKLIPPQSHKPFHLRIPAILRLGVGLVGVALCGLPFRTASGQGAPPPLEIPPGRLLRNAPDFSQWSVTFSYADDRAQKGDKNPVPDYIKTLPTFLHRPRKTLTTKTGDITSVQMVDVAGETSQLWTDHGVQYIKSVGTNVWCTVRSDMGLGDMESMRLPPGGFSELDWVGKDSYAGKIAYGDTQCLVFTPGGPASLDLSDDRKQKERMEALTKVAYIDDATRLPRALRIGEEVRIFQFTNPPPSAMQSLPPDLQAILAQAEKAATMLMHPAARPY